MTPTIVLDTEWRDSNYFAFRIGCSDAVATRRLKAMVAAGVAETRKTETLVARHWLGAGRLRRVTREYRKAGS